MLTEVSHLLERWMLLHKNIFVRRFGDMEKIRNKTYSIGEAARICGVTEKQIRHWEEKGHMPSLQRVICGKRSYRQFGDTELKQIRRIKKFLDEGFTLASAAKKAGAEITKKEEAKDGR
jgi:predicted transcriptional regulator